MTTDFDLLLCRLEAERKHLMEGLEQLKASVRQAGERRHGSQLSVDEVATEHIELKTCLTQQKQIIDRLEDVEQALRKFDNGTYGLCDICGQPIDLARLEALPAANLCLGCKVSTIVNR